jgi:predicted DNA-binding transcriptional regulator YafY
MSTNKNATVRYQTLDRCFRNPGRNYYIEDLIDACNDALIDLDPNSSGIKRRQIFDDIKFMRDSKGFDAPIETFKDGKRAFYRYSDLSFSINNQPLNEKEAQQLKEALTTLSRFKGLPQFDWIEELKVRLEHSFKLKSSVNIISFDDNVYLKGRELIGDLYNAIINQQTLSIIYKPFKSEENIQFEVHPYHLKQYNNRWFLWGITEPNDLLINLSLDRIISFSNSKNEYKPNTQINFTELFEDVIGVTLPCDQAPQKILLKVDASLWPYIETKPLHGSQKLKEKNSEFSILELSLILNYELEALIFSFGERLEVLEPSQLRDNLRNRLSSLLDRYKK